MKVRHSGGGSYGGILTEQDNFGLGMSSRVYATSGHIQDPVPLIDKRRGLSPGGRFPPSFIHQ